MKATVKWLQDVSFSGASASGHSVIMDGAPEFGGANQGMRPMEMLLLGMGGCTAFDVVHILRKARQDIVDFEVDLDAQRAEAPPKVFTRIHVHFDIRGRNVSPAAVERAIDLSLSKYCSATIMLAKTAEITHDYSIIDVD
ncbi:MAG: OsmC family protein [Gammaproteobacteria bacterium]|nr:OsmC family protein [Gammaproteobacteria bacterium]